MQKVAVTSEAPNLDSIVDPRFGRTAGFMIVDIQTMDFEYVDNGAGQAMAQGAGIQAAEIVAGTGAKSVLTGYVGPKAFAVLNAAGIDIYQDLSDITVRQAVERFKSGQLEPASASNKSGHWK